MRINGEPKHGEVGSGAPTLALMVVLLTLCGCKPDEGLRSTARKQWKEKAVGAITETYRDSTELTNELKRLRSVPATESDAPWFSQRLIVMTNGEWLVYTNRCRKEDPKIYDIFVARGSDGRWYYSTYHFCINTIVLRIDPRPASISEFIQRYSLRTFDGRSNVCLEKTWPPVRRN
jgi:hypothetical protein